jgi:uncharacterized protein DUF1843
MIPPYGAAIQQAIARGDLAEMKRLVATAEQFVAQNGDISAALELLKIEVVKLEHRHPRT